ncbi:baseplate wedge protein [Gordonia phage DalanDe]|nr:baseplate wedge protein [Gordonia phage DalanDe]
MTNLLSFPFRVDKNGTVATEDDESLVYCAERLTVFVGTRPGERVMVPDFGINDPAFEGFTTQALTVQVAKFGLPVEIHSTKRSYVSDAQENVTIAFDLAQSIKRGSS